MPSLFKFVTTNLNIQTCLICLVVFLLLASITNRYFKRKQNLPPGPTCWPVVGCIPAMVRGLTKMPAHELFMDLYQKYGPVYYLSTAFGRAVVICGHDAVNESLTCEDFNSRSSSRINKSDKLLGATGVIKASGDTWKEHRKFSLTVLRGFGVGKRSFEEQIASEIECLMQEITTLNGRPFNPTNLLCSTVSNVICSVVFGKRFEYHDQEFRHLLHLLEDSVGHIAESLLLMVMPFLYKVPFFPKGTLPSVKGLRMKLKEIINSHRDTYDEDVTRDFDSYLKELSLKNEQGIETHLSDDELVAVVHDLFLGGADTGSATLRWALLFMLKYPEVQTRVQDEIDSVVGRNRLPKLSDKPDLPYTEATIHEIQRFSCIVFMTPPRVTQKDVAFRGYTIPKGTTVLPNIYSTTRNPSIWEDPDAFKPERFLDKDGHVDNTAKLRVFGTGKRMCLGEQLVRMELFIFYTHLMHRYSFKKPKDVGNLNIRPKIGGILTPYPYEICAVVR